VSQAEQVGFQRQPKVIFMNAISELDDSALDRVSGGGEISVSMGPIRTTSPQGGSTGGGGTVGPSGGSTTTHPSADFEPNTVHFPG
jgi:hypothetical protein